MLCLIGCALKRKAIIRILGHNNILLMRIFLGQAFDQELIPRYGLPFAADAFSRNLLSGGGFDKSYTILPTSLIWLGSVSRQRSGIK